MQKPEEKAFEPIIISSACEPKKETRYKTKCPDCDADLYVPHDTEKGEILSCVGCGLELEIKYIKRNEDKKIEDCRLQELTIEGEDWGE